MSRIIDAFKKHPRIWTVARVARAAARRAVIATLGAGRLIGGLASVAVHPWFVRDALAYRQMGGAFSVSDCFPQFHDKTSETPIDPHYFYQAAWGAKLIHASGVKQHHDVGSSAAFIGMLCAFTNVHFIDLRPLPVDISGLNSVRGTVLDLPFEDATISSLSCLHVVEHIGLGRYGDPLDPEGSVKAAAELQRVLRPGGSLYFSVPIGVTRTQFNAHRVFAPSTVAELFPELTLVDFAVTDDSGRFHPHAQPASWADERYACGMYHFRRSA